jgi:predicted peptidase
MRKILTVLLFFITIGVGNIIYAQSENSDIEMSPGTHELYLPETDKRYTLVIPEGYTGRDSVPFILSLHYGGQVTPFYGRGLIDSLIAPALNELGAIIVAPDNIGRGWTNPAAEKNIFEFVDYVQSNYNIDRNKTLVTGVSMGGMGTWYIAPRYPERFKLAIPISGRPQKDSVEMDWVTPLYIIHSTDDEIVAIGPTIDAVTALKDKGASIEFETVDGLTHFQHPYLIPQLQAAIPWIRENWGE